MNWINLILVIFLVLLSGLFSGLNLGLLSLNKGELERKIKIGNELAKKVYSVRKKGNLLLSTLLLGNVLVNSVLAIFLNSFAVGVVAVIVSTGLIFIFGELIPQAFISRYALKIGAKTIWFVKFFIILLYPISWPISKLLDNFLGEEIPTIWSRRELEEIIKYHENSSNSTIDADEERIILGTLNFSNKIVKDIMTPRTVSFLLEENQILDEKLIKVIRKKGFSRIPIYKKEYDNITGLLFAKELIGRKPNKKVKTLSNTKSFLKVKETLKLNVLMNDFFKKKIHLAVVYGEYGSFRGIVTLEDILEEVLKKEIVDEYDTSIDMRKLAKNKMKKK